MDSSNKRIKCALLNAQSVRNKTTELRELIWEQGIDVFAITETWLSATDNLKINELLPNTHKLFHTPRNFGQGGGVGIVLSKAFTSVRYRVIGTFVSFEYLALEFKANNVQFLFVVVYRPPQLSKATFLEEFSVLLDCFENEKCHVYICGDFNLWLEDYRDTNVKKFLDLMNNMNFVNKVNVFTSRSGHILDAVFCYTGDNNFMNLIVDPDFSISFYHKLIMFEIKFLLPSKLKTKIIFRNKRFLNSSVLIDVGATVIEEKYDDPCECTDMNSSRNISVGECVVCLVALYFSVFSREYDKMCPMVEKDIVIKVSSPWFNVAIREARKKRRLAETRWKKHKTQRNRMLFVEARNEVNRLLRKVKKTYYNEKVVAVGSNIKRLYSVFDELLGKVKRHILPEGRSDLELANEFAEFFESKVASLLRNFTTDVSCPYPYFPDFPFSKFLQFKPISLDAYKTMFIGSSRSYCSNDPFPINEIIDAPNIDRLLKLQLKIVNLSITKSLVPSSEKVAIIKPSLKGSLDHQELKSYRPISNLSFLSKMIETSVLDQLSQHLKVIGAIPEDQSAYRKFHSTETALCAVLNDLLGFSDDGRCSLLILLDLSAAFDTVVHEMLIEDMTAIGIEGDALEWFINYLSNRSFKVKVNDRCSESRKLTTGVPQGSVLGPVLFSIYTIELSWIFKLHGVKCKFFADDTQFYLIVDDIIGDQAVIDRLMADVSKWMQKKKLKLNENKTECILIGTKYNLRKFDNVNSISINKEKILLADKVRDLGVIVDSSLTFDEHINNVVRTANFHLKNIASIRKYLNEDATKLLINSLVISRVDYCNSLYYNLPNYRLRKLQMILNRAARLIVCISPREHITPILINLHWLPVKARVIFKLCVLTYQAVNTGEPLYLKNCLKRYAVGPGVHTRLSSDDFRLVEPRAMTTLGTRTFKHCAPRLYNELPTSVKCAKNIFHFKKLLKTHLFSLSYNTETNVINHPYIT